jgi:hypothetical protein
MFKEGANMLTIQGKVKKSALKKVTNDTSLRPNQQWFFVDYAVGPVLLNAKFDVLLEGPNKQLISLSSLYSIRLLACLDQFGNKLDRIPKGFKTICKLEAHPKFPSALKNIQTLDEWDYNPNAISIVNHKEVALAVSDNLLFELYLIAFAQLKNTFHGKTRQHPLYKKDLVDYLTQSFKTPRNTADIILRALMQMGKVTRKKGNELELAD